MAFRVKVTPLAQSDADEFAEYLRFKLESEVTIGRWADGLYDAMETLVEMPQRCPLVRERHLARISIRELRYASHRIIFQIRDDLVMVLRIYHVSRRALKLT